MTQNWDAISVNLSLDDDMSKASSDGAKAFDFLATQLDRLEMIGRRRSLVSRHVDGVHVVERDGQRLLNFGGNDYLGVVADQLTPPVDQVGTGATASSHICGWSPQHALLAESIAALEKTESAVVFPSGFAACSGTVATLCRQGDLILSDELNHASLIDGCRWSKAECVIVPHRDTRFVESVLRERRGEFNQAWIVTDSVFSMDGDLAPLKSLSNIASRYDANLLVDEAHGTGVFGDSGGGLCDALGLHKAIPIRIGTLSKSVGHKGGFVAGPKVVIDYLIQFCRPLIYSTALSPQAASGAAWVIQNLPDWQERREHVAGLSRLLRQRLRSLRLPLFDLGSEQEPTHETLASSVPIVPIVIGTDQDAVSLSEVLREQGFFVPAIRPPTVPEGQARLRVSLSAAHTVAQVEQLVECLLKEVTR